MSYHLHFLSHPFFLSLCVSMPKQLPSRNWSTIQRVRTLLPSITALRLLPLCVALGLAEYVACPFLVVPHGCAGNSLVGGPTTILTSVPACHFGSLPPFVLIIYNTFDYSTSPRHVFFHTLFDLVPMRPTFPSSSRINMCCPILSDETGLPESWDTSSTRSLAYIHSPLGSAFSMASIM